MRESVGRIRAGREEWGRWEEGDGEGGVGVGGGGLIGAYVQECLDLVSHRIDFVWDGCTCS